ncbi:MAG: hypothetical protein IKQ11_01920 [Paludibacteraceae bacterium]|nr:hypothetical protein [Paludibacteraceae bacterium]
MTIRYKHLELVNLLFCYTPVFLFLWGWCRWMVSIPLTALILYMFFRYYRTEGKQVLYEESFTIHRKVWYPVMIGAAALAIALDYGGMFVNLNTFGDYLRNGAAPQDLARYDWPVIYDDAATPSMLTYYLGFYLFPGLVGKIFGSPILAEISLGIVGYIGMLLLFVNIIRLVNAQSVKAQFGAILAYLGFGGMLVFLQLVTFAFHPDVQLGQPHWFVFGSLQYRSTLVSLRWAFPQYYVPITCLILLYTHRGERKYYAMWVLPALLCGTWAFTMLVMYAIGDYIMTSVRDRKVHLDILSWQNIACAAIGLLMLTYLLGCWAVDATDNMQFQLITDMKYYLISYWPFCLFMFGFYFMLIWKETKKDDFFYLTLVFLCLLPFMRAGKYNDWVMGTSMPALFMLSIYCIRFMINKPTETKAKRRWVILIACLVLNVYYPLHELNTKYHYTGMPTRSMRIYSDQEGKTFQLGGRTYSIDLGWRTYFTNYNYEESFFYKHIARR